MATTVEAKTTQQAPAPAAPRPWYRARQRPLVGALIGVCIALMVTWLVMDSARRKERFATNSLNRAQMTLEAGNLPLASSELQRVITQYKGTDAATEAELRLNQVRMVNGQSELAAV